jgi:excinuclease ABC subunit C
VSFTGPAEVIDCTDTALLDARIDAAPAGPAVFAIWAAEGEPYVSRTNVLRRRLHRLLRDRTGSKSLNLRTVCRRVEFWPVASRLEGTLALYDVARRYAPEQYVDILHLRLPPYVRLISGIEFPRTQVTTRISGGAGQYFGPFRTRGSAENFEHELLDLFQIRRCQEDFQPQPGHPGCIYGEMNMCLRPCQQVVGTMEYASEVARVSDFLRTNGRTLLQSTEAARDRLSAEFEYEEAARQHKRVERITQVLALRDELAGDIDQLYGVAVTASNEPGCVALWFVLQGAWQPVLQFSIALEKQSLSMDRRLRDIASNLTPVNVSLRERQEHLAILARWYYSSWRDGQWVKFEGLDRLPYRKLVGAISRTAET